MTMKPNKRYQTPFGEAKYPHLTKADFQFRPEGLFHTKLLIDEQEAQITIGIINKSIEEKEAELKKESPTSEYKKAPLPYKTHKDDPSIPEGKVEFNFKMKASGINSKTKEKFEQKPNLYDHDLNAIPENKTIWNGSILRVEYEPYAYFVTGTGLGCSLRLKGVQVKSLVEGQVQDIGFTPVEQGEVVQKESNY